MWSAGVLWEHRVWMMLWITRLAVNPFKVGPQLETPQLISVDPDNFGPGRGQAGSDFLKVLCNFIILYISNNRVGHPSQRSHPLFLLVQVTVVPGTGAIPVGSKVEERCHNGDFFWIRLQEIWWEILSITPMILQKENQTWIIFTYWWQELQQNNKYMLTADTM